MRVAGDERRASKHWVPRLDEEGDLHFSNTSAESCVVILNVPVTSSLLIHPLTHWMGLDGLQVTNTDQNGESTVQHSMFFWLHELHL